jgi:hypothetical protein
LTGFEREANAGLEPALLFLKAAFCGAAGYQYGTGA